MEQLPPLTFDLIKMLDENEGPLIIKANTPHNEILWRAARRELIDSLRMAIEEPLFIEPQEGS